MSWLARSLANSLRLDSDRDGEGEDDDGDDTTDVETREENNTEKSELDQQGRGVKEDLTEFKQTLTRQLLGVASFLAPPPPSHSCVQSNLRAVESVSDPERCEPSDQSVSGEFSEEETLDSFGIKGDIAEIGGRFRSGISNLSNNIEVSDISEMDSNFQPFRSEGRDSVEEYDFEGIPGVTEEVLAFARNIAHHPETWLDFPLEEEDDLDGTWFLVSFVKWILYWTR